MEAGLEQRMMLTATAVSDTYTIQQDPATPPEFDVLMNDTSTGGTLSIMSTSTAAHGTVAIISAGLPRPVLRYTPTPGYSGTDTFTYDISSTSKEHSTGTGGVRS